MLRTALRAEVACLTQFVLSRAAIHAQKIWRGKLARGDRSNDGAKDKLRNFTNHQAYMGAYSACVQLQGWGRIRVAKKIARNVLWWRRYVTAPCASKVKLVDCLLWRSRWELLPILSDERWRERFCSLRRDRGWRTRARHGAARSTSRRWPTTVNVIGPRPASRRTAGRTSPSA